MRVLIARDDIQLRRIQQSIVAFKRRPAAERERMGLLLAALEGEELALQRARGGRALGAQVAARS